MKHRFKIVVQDVGRGYGADRVITKKGGLIDVEVSIDIEAIAVQLGEKAFRSKSGRSAGLNGKVKVKVLK